MDPVLLNLISELTESQRRDLFLLNKDLQRIYEQHVRGNSLNDTPQLKKSLSAEILKWGGLAAASLVAYNVLAARRSIDKDNDSLKVTFQHYARNQKSFRFLNNERDRVAGFVGDTFLKRKFPGTNKDVEQRFKTLIAGAQRTVDNIIELGVKDGTSAFEMAKQIEAYISPAYADGKRVAPWTLARRSLGKPISYIPKGVPAGSVEYNAMRIAVTETAYSYQQAPYLAHKDKWYYNGTKWVLSRSHPKPDTCDVYATHDEGLGLGIWIKPPKIPHPWCVLPETIVQAPNATHLMRTKYTGPIVDMLTASGRRLRVTPNHIMLTDRGWVRAKFLSQGDQIISNQLGLESVLPLLSPDDNDSPASVEEIFTFAVEHLGMSPSTVPATPKDLKGDVTNGKVDVIAINSELMNELKTAFPKNFTDLGLIHTGSTVGLNSSGDLHSMLIRLGLAADGISSRPSHSHSEISTESIERDSSLIRAVPNYQARLDKTSADRYSGNSELLTKLLETDSLPVQTDNLVAISNVEFSGHVYDLSTESTLYVANDYITSNCLCHTQVQTVSADEMIRMFKMLNW